MVSKINFKNGYKKQNNFGKENNNTPKNKIKINNINDFPLLELNKKRKKNKHQKNNENNENNNGLFSSILQNVKVNEKINKNDFYVPEKGLFKSIFKEKNKINNIIHKHDECILYGSKMSFDEQAKLNIDKMIKRWGKYSEKYIELYGDYNYEKYHLFIDNNFNGCDFEEDLSENSSVNSENTNEELDFV